MIHLFDDLLNGMSRSEMYRSWLVPDLFPHERQPVFKNWSADDIAMYVGVLPSESD